MLGTEAPLGSKCRSPKKKMFEISQGGRHTDNGCLSDKTKDILQQSNPGTPNTYFQLDQLKLKRRSSMNKVSSQNHNHDQNYQSGVVIYRNVKYSGLFYRSFIYLQTYFHFTVIQPWIPMIKKFHDFLSSQLVGIFYLLVFTPIHIIIALGLTLWRNIRIYLVNKYHPEAVLCETFSSEYVGVITSVIWLKGKVDVHKLSTIFSHSLSISSNLSHSVESRFCKLRMKLATSFGLHVFLPVDKREFNIKNHIEEAPKELLKYFVMNDIFQEEKSTLEKFVSKCASEKLDKELPPWKITLIPQSIFNKEKTCVVLKFHSILLEDPSVSKIIDNIFHQTVYPDSVSDGNQNVHISNKHNSNNNYNNNLLLYSSPFLHGGTEKKIPDRIGFDSHFIVEKNSEKQQDVYEDENYNTNGNIYGESQDYYYQQQQQLHFQDPKDILTFFTRMKIEQFCKWCYHNLYFSSSDITTWINLQKKQFEFHGRFYLLNALVCELLISFKKLFWLVKSIQPCFHQQLNELKPMLKLLVLVIRALIYVPAEILSTIMCHTHSNSCSYTRTKRMSGFQRMKEKQMRRIAFGGPISKDLIKNIKDKTGASTSSIILTACSMSLNDFYGENNLPNPNNLGVMILPFVSGNLMHPTGYRTINLRTDKISILEHLQMVDEKIGSFPRWKVLGNYYIIRYLSYFVPRSVTRFILQRIFKRYPLTFSKMNLQAHSSIQLPHISLWGQTVDEFCFWNLPQSDFCVSITLINYAENMRLHVLSPFKSLDTVLTKKIQRYLNLIAEKVGVEKTLIPYSRRNSPAQSNNSSNCSSPQILRNTNIIIS